jgi:hypothetical protein
VGQRPVPGSGGSLAETKDILPAASADLLPHQASQASPRQVAPMGQFKRIGLSNPDFCLFCVSKDFRLFDKKLANMTNRTASNFTISIKVEGILYLSRITYTYFPFSFFARKSSFEF